VIAVATDGRTMTRMTTGRGMPVGRFFEAHRRNVPQHLDSNVPAHGSGARVSHEPLVNAFDRHPNIFWHPRAQLLSGAPTMGIGGPRPMSSLSNTMRYRRLSSRDRRQRSAMGANAVSMWS
jgi:hypothetical protein